MRLVFDMIKVSAKELYKPYGQNCGTKIIKQMFYKRLFNMILREETKRI